MTAIWNRHPHRPSAEPIVQELDRAISDLKSATAVLLSATARVRDAAEAQITEESRERRGDADGG